MEICRATVLPPDCIADNGVNLRMLTGTYLVSLPADPQAPAAGTGTSYTIVRDANGRITVRAWRAEQTASISVTR
jgi:hypothetical protein